MSFAKHAEISPVGAYVRDHGKVWDEDDLIETDYGIASPDLDVEIQKAIVESVQPQPKQCFANATEIVENFDATYVDGFVTVGVVPLEHAWVLVDGEFFDPTLPDYRGEYYGVEISDEQYERIEDPSYGVIGNHKDGFSILDESGYL